MIAETALSTTLALFGLWFAVYYFWRDYRHDVFRDHLFSIRDEMFLWAANGNIGFDNPAYSMLRGGFRIYGDHFPAGTDFCNMGTTSR